ncbi:MAG: ATP-dependent helicase [Paludibacteraceae bacterium]|nr:ATP-dependent helicase [Paludibacteraceae bacterium]
MDKEITQIMRHIHEGHHFLLSGGAGSGKTYTLVQVIKEIIKENPSSLIACITYTNAAVREIENRVNHNNLRVSTIHDFLWECISNFQKELLDSVVELINNESIKINSSVSLPITSNFFVKDEHYLQIQYKEYLRVADGIISHDEVLKVANYMFSHYPKLCKIVKGTYPFILIDEYQDTNPLVVKILLKSLDSDDNRLCHIGFFGDAMQAIYDDGIGDINDYKSSGKVYEVKKEQNRRSPKKVIELANKIRLDDLVQHHSKDVNAPNMMLNGQVKEGRVLFVYSQAESTTIDDVRGYLRDYENWNFDDSKATKELNLTHRLIAGKAGFATLMEIHSGDAILKYRDKVKKFVVKKSVNTDGKTFGEILSFLYSTYTDAQEMKDFSQTQDTTDFINNNQSLYKKVLDFSYDEFVKMYVTNDQLIDDKKQEEDETSKTGSKRSELVQHLMKIERCIYLYSSGNIGEFLKSTEKAIHSISDKRKLHDAINQLINVGDKNIGEIIEKADEFGIVRKDEALERYAERNPYVYERVKTVAYTEVQSLYKYLEGMTPFSTQHKTKGAEFDNVLVILENGKWNNYNFEKLFTASGNDLSESVVQRTRKIFYVCCTRTKENLAVYYHNPSDDVLAKARDWFGTENVIPISNN